MVHPNICKINRLNRKRFLARRKRIRRMEKKSLRHKRPLGNDMGASSSTSLTAKSEHCGLCLAPLNFGAPEYACVHCGAMFWLNESLTGTRSSACPSYSLCCRGGRIQLPLLSNPPRYLLSLLDGSAGRTSKIYRANIRRFNSLFAFTSSGAKVDHHITDSAGPAVYRIHGENYHLIGSLLPVDGHAPQFAQLYVYDTDNEIENRIKALGQSKVDHRTEKHMVNEFVQMLDDHNALVKIFRMARDRFRNTDCTELAIKLVSSRASNGLQYDAPRVSEIAGLIVGDLGCGQPDREIIVEQKTGKLHRIDMLHPSYMALQYPLLFPYGENGFSLGLQYTETGDSGTVRRKYMTMAEYYSFRLQQRGGEGQTILRGGRLFHQYLVDAFTCVEQSRLNFIRNNQDSLRSEMVKGIQDAIHRGDRDSKSLGKRIVLPPSFMGGPRYMFQNYQDALAICGHYGPPHLFVTFTCNSGWPEIKCALLEGQRADDRPDLIARVFKMKVDEFISDIKEGTIFGPITAVVYTIEFQKRGMPHVHVIVWLCGIDKTVPIDRIDQIISAEIPDSANEPEEYEVVKSFMMHGPCGAANPQCPCMINGICSKQFPKRFIDSTHVDDNGSVKYKRRDNGRVV